MKGTIVMFRILKKKENIDIDKIISNALYGEFINVISDKEFKDIIDAKIDQKVNELIMKSCDACNESKRQLELANKFLIDAAINLCYE